MRASFLVLFIATSFLASSALAQRVVGADTLYGNEWLEAGQQYWKLRVGARALVSISGSDLAEFGADLSQLRSDDFTVYNGGKKVPVYALVTSGAGVSTQDQFYFLVDKNRSEFDRWMYGDTDSLLHPSQSLISDTATYFLTFEEGGHPRYEAFVPPSAPSGEISSVEGQFIQTWTTVGIRAGESSNIALSEFDPGEGFSSTQRSSWNYNHPLPGVISGTLVDYNIRLTGSVGFPTHNVTLTVDGTELPLTSFSRSDLAYETASIVHNSTEQNARISYLSSGSADRISLGEVTTRYRRTSRLDSDSLLSFRLSAGVSGQLPLISSTTSSPLFVIDQNEQKIALLDLVADTAWLNVTPSSESRRFVAGVPVEKVQLTPWEYEPIVIPSNVDYLLLSSYKLLSTAGPSDIVNRYEAFRESVIGGLHKVATIYVEDLYDIYGFGISNHPQAIRNAVHQLRTQSSVLKYLFILGKGRVYSSIRTDAQLNDPSNATAFIPTFGSPPSDNLLSAWPRTPLPLLYTARLPAQSLDEVENYFNKVVNSETSLQSQDEQEIRWRKRVMHLGGGTNPFEQSTIRATLELAENQIEGAAFANEVYSFYRQSSQPVESSQLDAIYAEINKGLNLLTFFGHSATGAFGFSIDNPERYDNAGKLPLLLSFGCLSGNVHLPGAGINEEFINQELTGAIAVASSSALVFQRDMARLIPIMYEVVGSPSNEPKTVGSEVTKGLVEFYNRYNGVDQQSVLEQFQLIGDPAVRMHQPDSPDYTFDMSTAQISPSIADPSVQEVLVDVDMVNLGLRVDSTISIVMVQNSPTGTIKRDSQYLQSQSYRTSLQFRVDSFSSEAGTHRFDFIVDGENVVSEAATIQGELNNMLSTSINGRDLTLDVINNSARALYPPNYSSLSSPVRLLASTSNPLAREQTYKFQISVDPTFSSGITEKEFNQGGGLLAWEDLSLNPGTYFWRVAPVNTDTTTAGWSNSSFSVVAGGTNNIGVALKAGPQIASGPRTRIYNDGQNWQFANNITEVVVTNVKRTNSLSTYPQYSSNGAFTEGSYGNDIRSGVYIAVFDSLSGASLIQPPGGLHGSETPASWRQRNVFPFLMTSPEERRDAVAFLDTVAKVGNYVVFFTIQGENGVYDATDWALDSLTYGENIFSVLEAQGAMSVRSIVETPVPYIFAYQKDVRLIEEKLATSDEEEITVNISIAGRWFEGAYVSPSLGAVDTLLGASIQIDDPRTIDPRFFEWSLLHDKTGGGVDTLFNGTDLQATLPSTIRNDDVFNLRVMWSFIDSFNRRPLNVIGFDIEATPVGELVWDANTTFEPIPNEVRFGDSLKVIAHVSNASRHRMPATLLTVAYQGDGRLVELDSVSVQALAPFEGVDISYVTRNESNNINELSLRALLNADNGKVEQRYTNNLLRQDAKAISDKSAPALKVYADGDPLLDGQLVSAAPTILIDLLDDFETADINIERWIINHSAPSGQQTDLASNQTNLIIEQLEDNRLNIVWTPESLEDGIHELFIVARDAAQNTSSQPLRVSFEVVNRQTISSFLPYPNPAVDNIRFAYELTGAAAIDAYQIDIYTSSGRLVHSLDASHLGTLTPGRKLTEASWDGRDMFGQKLARGTYLYRVNTQSVTTQYSIEHRETKMDAFTSKFGKLVLLR